MLLEADNPLVKEDIGLRQTRPLKPSALQSFAAGMNSPYVQGPTIDFGEDNYATWTKSISSVVEIKGDWCMCAYEQMVLKLSEIGRGSGLNEYENK